MSDFAPSVRRRCLSVALGTSSLAWGLLLPAAAHAQCTPDPTVANGTTTCTGNDADGIRVTTPGTTLTVANGASVTGNAAPAIAVDVPAGSSYGYSTETIDVLGSVSASGQNAIAVFSGAPSPADYYSGQQVALTVGIGASISGTSALALLPTPGNANGTVWASIDNAGTLTGTGGTALLGNATSTSNGYTSPLTGFSAVTNRAAGIIVGGIAGPVATLTNAGSIDGGAASAVDAGISSPSITNAAGATIRSASTAPTVLAGSAFYLSVNNAGVVANSGDGAALSGGTLFVTNQRGGLIDGGGAAIAAAASLNLVNQGAVTGDVVTGNGASMVDSTAGTIEGSVTFGSGSDTLLARYAGTRALATGITGAITAGGGTDTERVVFATDTSVTTPIDLNAGFQNLVLAPDAGVTATLQTGFSTATALVLSGTGAVVNRATISLAGPAVTDLDYAFGSSASFRNEGSITATLPADSYQGGLTFSNHSFTNAGAVTVTGGTGVAMSYNPVDNSGTITASGVGVSLFDGVLTNSGTIVSTGAAGVTLTGDVGYTGSNSGTIRGATTGAAISIYLTNSGTISSAGVGVTVRPYGYLINAAGGVVNGGDGGAVTVGPFEAGVANAGTIHGDVTFNGLTGFGSANSLAYIALTGGTLDGNLTLNGGVTLVTDLVNAGPGQFAGITGTVTADSDSALRYAVNADASAVPPAGGVGPFATVGYQLANGAHLTLTAPAAQTGTQTLALAGNGSVDLDVTIATTGAAALQSTRSITYPGAASVPDALSIINRGALGVTRTDNGSYYANAAVILSPADTFTNVGDIAVTDHLGYNTAGISGGASVTNDGRIVLDGGVGIAGATSIVNTGTISQVAGGAIAQGAIVAAGSFDNSGTISVGGSAVRLGAFYGSSAVTLRNSGTLASTGGPAVTSDPTSYGRLTIGNLASGTIVGSGDSAIQVSNAVLSNAGTIMGTVDLGYAAPSYSGAPARAYASSTYIADGGTIAGDLLFGAGDDVLLQTGDALGVSRTIDGGAGTDIYGRSLAHSGTMAIDPAGVINFEDGLVQALGAGTVVTVTATGTFGGNLYAVGTGSVVNEATIAGMLTTSLPYRLVPPFTATPLVPGDQILSALTNAGSVAGGVSAVTPSFTNTGTISSSGADGATVSVYGGATLGFTNSGTVSPSGAGLASYVPTVTLAADAGIAIDNSGRISGGGLAASVSGHADGSALSLGFTNSGTIASGNGTSAVGLGVGSAGGDAGGTIRIANSGTISAQGVAASGGAANGLDLYVQDGAGPFTYAITNGGTIAAASAPSGGFAPRQAVALIVDGARLSGTVNNGIGGSISADGERAYGIVAANSPLNLVNAGTIRATGTIASIAIQTFGAFADRITNTGTITGDIILAEGADTIDNAGTITGTVSLGAGDDIFIQRAGAILAGRVDGGDGTDAFMVDATGGTTTLAASQIANFERLTQTGTGTGIYSGSFGVGTIGIAGGTLAVAAGQTLATLGATTITASDGSGDVSVTNAGTIAGGIALAGGNDTVVNTGSITGAVTLGAGNDTYVEGVGSVATGGVDGGDGIDLYRVVLAGDRTGIGARSNFERLAVDGTGTLTLSLDQSFQSVALTGTGLIARLGGFAIGRIDGTAAAEQVSVDGDIAAIALGGGDDQLTLGTAHAAGTYDGGAGNDVLRFSAAGPVTLAGSATGFEQVTLAGGALTITGTLGAAGAPLSFGAGDQQVTVGDRGTLAGNVDLGDGNDGFRLSAGGILDGTVAGGAGNDIATVELAGNRTLAGGTLTGFETLAVEGSGQLSLAGTHAYDRVTSNADLAIAADGSLTAAQVQFDGGNNRFAIAGGFAGSIDGGAGNDTIAVSGGSAAAPVAFGSIANVEAFGMSGGYATIGGTASVGTVDLTGGRLVGLSGSIITAPQILVRQGATFGSAGIVNGSIAVAGTLSPGASPGTMTVNGNVSLAAGSTSLFELTPTVSDKLLVSGTLSIASGTTLTLVGDRPLTPGAALDLIVANGGISGSFTTVNQAATILGFLRQLSDRIQLFGQFAATGFNPQVTATINYVNGLLTAGKAGAPLFAAVPSLLTSGNATNGAAFARLNPEVYASATQIGIENGLTLAQAARSDASATPREEAGPFSFAQGLGTWRPLDGNAAQGTSRARTNSYGLLGGLGFGSAQASLGAFAGYLDSHQRIAELGARTRSDGIVAGLLGHAAAGGFDLSALLAYDGGRADTTRALPGSSTATGRYHLRGWVGDGRVGYAVPLGSDWALKPAAGVTYVATRRAGTTETGGGAFSLDVAGRRSHATFVDGDLTLRGGTAPGARVQPWISAGVRHQLNGRATLATAGFAGTDVSFSVPGVSRKPTLATAGAGLSVLLAPGLDAFAAYRGEFGSDGTGTNLNGGLRLHF